jgi:hypothetical protein
VGVERWPRLDEREGWVGHQQRERGLGVPLIERATGYPTRYIRGSTVGDHDPHDNGLDQSMSNNKSELNLQLL